MGEKINSLEYTSRKTRRKEEKNEELARVYLEKEPKKRGKK
jgi:hypothetical protein